MVLWRMRSVKSNPIVHNGPVKLAIRKYNVQIWCIKQSSCYKKYKVYLCDIRIVYKKEIR